MSCAQGDHVNLRFPGLLVIATTLASCGAAVSTVPAPIRGATTTAVGALPAGMVLIPAGPFKMGCVPRDSACKPDEKPQHTVTLDAYAIAVHEVTVANYKACVDAGKCTAPRTGNRYNWGVAGRDQHPIDGVNWAQADAYCKWLDVHGHLPTEAQWEKAARGGLTDTKYPWGDADPTCTPGRPHTAVWADSSTPGCGTGGTWPVATGSAQNGYGLADMAGNVMEFVADPYDDSYYADSPASNPPGRGSGNIRIMRGGAFTGAASDLRTSRRIIVDPTFLGGGFRCVTSVVPGTGPFACIAPLQPKSAASQEALP